MAYNEKNLKQREMIQMVIEYKFESELEYILFDEYRLRAEKEAYEMEMMKNEICR